MYLFDRDLFKTVAIAAVAILGIGGCATPIDTFSDYDNGFAFENLESFAWISDNPMKASPRNAAVNPFLEGRVKDAIRNELTARGYRYERSASRADFVVSFSVGGRKELNVDSYPVAYRHHWTWGGAYFGESVSVEQSTEGTLAIDFFSATTKSPIWHGIAHKNLTSAEEKLRGSIINDAVSAILAEFPPP